MNDLISRQAVFEALEKVVEFYPYKVPGDYDTYSSYNEAWNDAIGRAEMEIESLPSVQSEIIRCKDCQHRMATPDGDAWICAHPNNNAWSITEEHYCGYAERRTNEEKSERYD